MRVFTLIVILFLLTAGAGDKPGLSISRTILANKVKGGWAGQVIGVAFANSSDSSINPISRIQKKFILESFENNPEAFDDVFLELALMEVIEKNTLQAPSGKFASAYLNARCQLHHANQSARYNLLNGMKPPQSGHWLNNPHANDIDFQVQSDFIGLMSPGMPATVYNYADRIGHIISFGDGFYGGLYVANLYSYAFIQADVKKITDAALRSVPYHSRFYECIADVQKWSTLYPSDWRHAKNLLERKWGNLVECPDRSAGKRVDARLNAGYITLGLLYGKGSFAKTLEICSELFPEADNHTAAAAGILGVIHGYDKIPDAFKNGIEEIEYRKFGFADLTLAEAYAASTRHALQNIGFHHRNVKYEKMNIDFQEPSAARYERSFEGHVAVENRCLNKMTLDKEFQFEFEGVGFVLRGDACEKPSDFIFDMEIYVDHKFVERVRLPANVKMSRRDLAWKFQLPHGLHAVKVVVLNPEEDQKLRITDVVVYNVSKN